MNSERTRTDDEDDAVFPPAAVLPLALLLPASGPPSGEARSPDVDQLPLVELFTTEREPASDAARAMLTDHANCRGYVIREVSDPLDRRRAGVNETPCLRMFDRGGRRVGTDLWGGDVAEWGRVARWLDFPDDGSGPPVFAAHVRGR